MFENKQEVCSELCEGGTEYSCTDKNLQHQGGEGGHGGLDQVGRDVEAVGWVRMEGSEVVFCP
jgi:hypothetical protein